MINSKPGFIFPFVPLVLSSLAFASVARAEDSNLWHPGSGDFLEIGMVKNFSALGYQVYSPYLVPKFNWGRFELMQSRISYYALETSFFKLGPGLNFVPPVYLGTEIESLKGMSRSLYFEGVAVAQFSTPLGQVEIAPRYPLYSGDRGIDLKASYATGIPAFMIGSNRSWVNLQYEFTLFSPETASYYFGVTEKESTPQRPAYRLERLASHSLVTAFWTPLSKQFWVTTTYKRDWFPSSLLKSPIVRKNRETTVLIGLLYSFH